MGRSYAGDLLISRPQMIDPNFDHTISYVLEHGDDGAVAVIVNRPTPLTVSDAFPDWEGLVASPPVIFQGGPVQTNSIIALGSHRAEAQSEAQFGLPPGLTSVDLDSQPTLMKAEGLEEMRIFAGYAGWGAGQLEEEIANGGWWIVPGGKADVFCAEPQRLWADVMKRNGGELRWFAHLSIDPTSN